jgi:hypothetical protein
MGHGEPFARRGLQESDHSGDRIAIIGDKATPLL